MKVENFREKIQILYDSPDTPIDSQQALSRYLNVDSATVGRWVGANEIKRNPRDFCRAFRIDDEWLLFSVEKFRQKIASLKDSNDARDDPWEELLSSVLEQETLPDLLKIETREQMNSMPDRFGSPVAREGVIPFREGTLVQIHIAVPPHFRPANDEGVFLILLNKISNEEEYQYLVPSRDTTEYRVDKNYVFPNGSFDVPVTGPRGIPQRAIAFLFKRPLASKDFLGLRDTPHDHAYNVAAVLRNRFTETGDVIAGVLDYYVA